MTTRTARIASLLTAAACAAAGVLGLTGAPAQAAGGVDDPTCRPSAAHPDPVVFLHGLGATKDEDTNVLQSQVAAEGYCTYALTYGQVPAYPFFGGLQPIATSAKQIADFVRSVKTTTGAAKVDLVGHSEGGFQALYVTKTQGLAASIGKVVAIAPPSHGTTFGGVADLAYVGGDTTRSLISVLLRTGCPACDDLVTGGGAVATLDRGPIAQPGVAYTIITSRYDELVTPTGTAFVREPGVHNAYVQDTCPLDPVGHLGEAYDPNVRHLVDNALDPAHAASFTCLAGPPG